MQPALLAGRPGPSRGSLRSPRAASSGPRLREAHPRLGPRSRGGGSRPRESPDAPLRAEEPPHAGLRERAEGTGAADTRDSSPRPATRPARAKVPAQTGDEREASASARSLRRLLARRSHRAAPAFQPPAAQPGARGRRSQSERGNSWGRSRLCSSAQPPPPLGLLPLFGSSSVDLFAGIALSRERVSVEPLRCPPWTGQRRHRAALQARGLPPPVVTPPPPLSCTRLALVNLRERCRPRTACAQVCERKRGPPKLAQRV